MDGRLLPGFGRYICRLGCLSNVGQHSPRCVEFCGGIRISGLVIRGESAEIFNQPVQATAAHAIVMDPGDYGFD